MDFVQKQIKEAQESFKKKLLSVDNSLKKMDKIEKKTNMLPCSANYFTIFGGVTPIALNKEPFRKQGIIE